MKEEDVENMIRKAYFNPLWNPFAKTMQETKLYFLANLERERNIN